MDERLEEIEKIIDSFVKKRHWEKYHNPKSLAMSISIEAAEIMELFQWSDNKESGELVKDKEIHANLKGEIADVAIYLLYLAKISNINVLSAIKEKMAANEIRFSPENSLSKDKK